VLWCKRDPGWAIAIASLSIALLLFSGLGVGFLIYRQSMNVSLQKTQEKLDIIVREHKEQQERALEKRVEDLERKLK
jgi:hypothetical protein